MKMINHKSFFRNSYRGGADLGLADAFIDGGNVGRTDVAFFGAGGLPLAIVSLARGGGLNRVKKYEK